MPRKAREGDTAEPHAPDPDRKAPPLAVRAIAFCRKLRARGDPDRGKPADKAFVDSLYDR